MSSTLILLGKVAATGAIAAGALVGGVTATHSTAAPTTTSGSKVHCQKYRHAPAALKADLKKLRALPKGEARAAAAKQVRKDARAGKYGARVQRITERRKAARAAFLESAPAQLRTDLRAAAAKPAGPERRDALTSVWTSALKGTYGADVQARAEMRKDHRTACRAKRATRNAA
jgi:hypothetical protein